MLDALKGQLCSKLCRHNIRTPRAQCDQALPFSFVATRHRDHLPSVKKYGLQADPDDLANHPHFN